MAYATRADLYRLGLREEAFSAVSTTDQDAAIEAASDVADSYLRARYVLPLTGYGDDLKSVVCRIAAYELLATRGYAPGVGGDESLEARHDKATAWLKDVSTGRAAVSGGNTTPGPSRTSRVSSGRPSVYSANQQGWYPPRRR